MPVGSQTEAPPAGACPRLLVHRLDSLPDAEAAFVHLYGASRSAFWLDSAAGGERGRFSFIGDGAGPLGAVVTYDVGARSVRVERAGAVERFEESIFDYLRRELDRRSGATAATSGPDGASEPLPFDFDCGFVGYLGYELKADCDGEAVHRAQAPDAALCFADRLIAFDRVDGCAYLVSLVEAGADAVREGERWIGEVARRLAALPAPAEPRLPAYSGELRWRRSPRRHLEDVAACKRYLRAGHSYEICLTNKIVGGREELDPLVLYRVLRRVNPAPFSAYLRFGDRAVLSSSPERFLAVGEDGRVETRPIKGTSRRGIGPAEDEDLAAALSSDRKSRAENVTIVDLMRNDLGRVCELGSVEAPQLMRVESYETLHQLVSSVRGRLRGDVGAVEAARACFPPGSMTGAPKVRTMQIIDELEGEARGVYSGAIGYFGLGGGCDLSVAIRTIVLDGQNLSVGAGGAIVVDSDPVAELEEMRLKAAAPIAALGEGAAISFAPCAAPGPLRRGPLSPTPS